MTGPTELAERLALSLSRRQRDELVSVQARLAKVQARLWDLYAELLDVKKTVLASTGRESLPVSIETFQPGDTLHIGESFVRSDPRLELLERLNLDSISDLLGELGEAVLNAPELGRLALLSLFSELDAELIEQVIARYNEPDTEEFPANPLRGGRP